MHGEQNSKHQYKKYTNNDDDRGYYYKFLDMLQQTINWQSKESNKKDADHTHTHRSFLDKFMEVMHRSAIYRPSSTFWPIAGAVILIYGSISMVLGVFHLYRGARYVCL